MTLIDLTPHHVHVKNVITYVMTYCIPAEKYNLSLVDALVVSTAINAKSSLVTRDDEIKKVKEVEAKAPEELA